MKFFPLTLLLSIALLPVVLHAAPHACTEMGCQNGLNITLDSPSWPKGAYTFTVVADGKTTTCTGSLPFKDCDSHVSCSDTSVQIGESGCAMPPETHGFFGIMMPTVPKQFALTIRHESGKQFSFNEAIAAVSVRPNGQQCEPACIQATLSKTVVFE